jgi:hypothetical protein
MRKTTIFRYVLQAAGLAPEMRGHRHMSEDAANFTTKNQPGLTFLKVDVKSNFKSLDAENMLTTWPVLDKEGKNTGAEAIYCGHGSSVKHGYVYFLVVRRDGQEIVEATDYLVKAWEMLGISENLYRFGAHLMPKTMASLTMNGAKVMGVPDGSILYCSDGKKSLFRDGHGVINKSLKAPLMKQKPRVFQFKDGSLLTPTVFSQLDFSQAVADELLEGFEKRSKALTSESYFKFVQASRFGNERGENLIGKSIFADVAMMEEVMAEIARRGINGEVQNLLARHPAFSPRLAKGLARDMYKVATTGGLKGTYYKIAPCPSLPGETEPVIIRKSNKTGKALVIRYPVSDSKSVLAATSKEDRLDFKGEMVQLRVTTKNLTWSAKGTATFRNLESAYIITPDGERIEVPSDAAYIWGSEDQKMPCKPNLMEVITEDIEVMITEWYRPADVALMPCGYVDGVYHEELDHAHSQNADFDGDGVVVSWVGNRPNLWQAFKALNGTELAVAKMKKSKTPLVKFSNLNEFQANSTTVYQMIGRSIADYVGQVTNLMQRYLLYSPAQREKLAQARFNMSRLELEAEFAFYLQLAVDLFKFNDSELVEKLARFIAHVEAVFRLEASLFNEGDGLGKIKMGHVGKDKNQANLGKGYMWFTNHIPEVDEFAGCDGFIPSLMRQTLARDESGNFVLWGAEIANKGILPNATYQVWVAPTNQRALKLAGEIKERYGKEAYGLAVGYEVESGNGEDVLKSEWLDFITEFRAEIVEQARRERISLQDLFDALWFSYTNKPDQQGDQSMPILLLPEQFFGMVERLIKDEFGQWVHPDLKGKLIDKTQWLPLLNISQQWVNYPESPLVKGLDGKAIVVEAQCHEVVRSGQKRVVSVVIPEDDAYEAHLREAKGLPLGSLGYTLTTYEGKFKAMFRWTPGKTNGGTMNVALIPA